MKRQVEDLFFKYKGHPYLEGTDAVVVNLPEDYDPLPGDIIEMIVSENQEKGYVTYYAKLICYSDAENQIDAMNIEALDGKLVNVDSTSIPLDSCTYLIKEDNKKYVQLVTSPELTVYVNNSADYIINVIVHRAKGNTAGCREPFLSLRQSGTCKCAAVNPLRLPTAHAHRNTLRSSA